MNEKSTSDSLDALFKEVYDRMVPPDYEKMPIDELAQYDNIEAKKVYARRTSKLGEYLEGVE